MTPMTINQNELELNLIYDKLAFTLFIPKSKRLPLLNRINDPQFYRPFNRRVYRNKYNRYKNNYQFTLFEDNTIEVSLYPINTHHNFLRVEYNPNKLGTKGCIRLRKFLIKLLGLTMVKKIYFTARVTRLDLTLDIHGLKPHYYIHKPKVLDSVINRNLKGQIESQILGSDNSNCRVTLYDKNAEQAAKGNEVSATPYQRIEVRLRELNCTMAELPGLKEKLLGELQQINFFSKSLLVDDQFSDRFKKQVYQHGLNNVLGRISQVDRNKARRYRRYVRHYQVKPFDVHDLDFDATHWAALGTLVHPDYRGGLL